MATFSIEIPAEQVDRVTGALAEAYGYSPQVEGEDGVLVPNPQTVGQFAREQVARFILTTVTAVEAQRASEAATQQATAAVMAEVTIL